VAGDGQCTTAYGSVELGEWTYALQRGDREGVMEIMFKESEELGRVRCRRLKNLAKLCFMDDGDE
jgi:hypothetical protein